MKVCIVSSHYPSDDGVGEYCGHIAEELCKRIEVVVLANKNPSLPTSSRIDPSSGSRQYIVRRIWKAGLFYPFTIFRGVIREKPDIVHIQHEYFLYGERYKAILFPIILLLIRIARIPLVVTMHHVIPRKEVSHFRTLLRMSIPKFMIAAFLTFFNRLFSFSSKIIVPSSTFKQTLLTDYKISDKQIEVVPHFAYRRVTSIGKDDTNAKASLGLYGKKIVLFFGYIRPPKGIEYMLCALPKVIKEIPDVRFSIVGGAKPDYAAYLNYLVQLVNELELSSYVRFEGYVPEELLPIAFAASDVIVFPYTSTIGMTPIAHLQAAAYGKPVIATDIDSFNKEFVDHKNALIVPRKDPDALSKSIIEIFTDDTLSKKLSNNIVLYCAERSQERTVGGIIKIYQDMLQRSGKHHGVSG
jgi:glycosyltransferase involved in cell wall biosynthesis